MADIRRQVQGRAHLLGSTAFIDRSFPFILNIYIIANLLTKSIYGILQMVLA